MAFFQFAGRSPSEMASRATWLAFAGLRVHCQHFDIEQLGDRPADVRLRGQVVDLEGVGVVARRAVHTLFGHQRAHNDLVRLEDDRRRLLERAA